MLQIRILDHECETADQETCAAVLRSRRLLGQITSADQYSTGRKASISRSRSAIRRNATDGPPKAHSKPGPTEGAHLIAHKPVEDASGLLGIHDHLQRSPAVSEGSPPMRAGRDLVKHNARHGIRWNLPHFQGDARRSPHLSPNPDRLPGRSPQPGLPQPSMSGPAHVFRCKRDSWAESRVRGPPTA